MQLPHAEFGLEFCLYPNTLPEKMQHATFLHLVFYQPGQHNKKKIIFKELDIVVIRLEINIKSKSSQLKAHDCCTEVQII